MASLLYDDGLDGFDGARTGMRGLGDDFGGRASGAKRPRASVDRDSWSGFLEEFDGDDERPRKAARTTRDDADVHSGFGSSPSVGPQVGRRRPGGPLLPPAPSGPGWRVDTAPVQRARPVGTGTSPAPSISRARTPARASPRGPTAEPPHWRPTAPVVIEPIPTEEEIIRAYQVKLDAAAAGQNIDQDPFGELDAPPGDNTTRRQHNRFRSASRRVAGRRKSTPRRQSQRPDPTPPLRTIVRPSVSERPEDDEDNHDDVNGCPLCLGPKCDTPGVNYILGSMYSCMGGVSDKTLYGTMAEQWNDLVGLEQRAGRPGFAILTADMISRHFDGDPDMGGRRHVLHPLREAKKMYEIQYQAGEYLIAHHSSCITQDGDRVPDHRSLAMALRFQAQAQRSLMIYTKLHEKYAGGTVVGVVHHGIKPRDLAAKRAQLTLPNTTFTANPMWAGIGRK